MIETPEERIRALIAEGLAMYETPLRTLVWLKWSWADEPRGDSVDIIDGAEETLLQTMSRAERGLWTLLLGQSLDFDEAMDLATAWELEQIQRDEQYGVLLKELDNKPRKPFPWKTLSPREDEIMRRKAE